MAKTSFYSGSGTNSTDVAAIDSLKTAAEAAKTAAETAQAAAETAQANAETSATNAASSETSGSTSASTATTKASEAAASASAAASSASSASTSATAAATSATAAAASVSASMPKAGGTFTGNVSFGDNDKIIMGDGTDLQIYSDTTAGILKGDDVRVYTASGADVARFYDGLDLYHNGSLMFQTTNTGIDVTGNITASGTVDGVDIASRDVVLTSTTTTANAAMPKSGGVFTGNISFEGATANDYETTITVTDPTADRTITLPDATGTVALTSDITIADDAVTGAKIADDAVDSEHIANGAIDTAHIGDDQVTYAKIQNVSSNNVLLGNDDGEGSAVQELTAANVRTIINVEDGADVTDATNVTAAGALMDSEVDNLAQVKAFDSSDYATAAQGSTADAAMPKAGGTFTGDISFEGATANDYETTLTVTDPTDDRTITLPDASGTVLLSDGDGSNLTGLIDTNFTRVSSANSGSAAIKYIKVATIDTSSPDTSNSTFVFRILLEGRSSLYGSSQFRIHVRTGEDTSNTFVVVEQEHNNTHDYYGADSFIFDRGSQSNSVLYIKLPNNNDTAYLECFAKLEVAANQDTTYVSGSDDVTIHTNQLWWSSISTTSPITASWIKKKFADLEVDGDITVSGTVDGVDIAATATTANAAMPKAGGTFTGDVSVTGRLQISNGSTSSGYIDLLEDSDNGTNKIKLEAPQIIASDKTITLPDKTGVALLDTTSVGGVLLSQATINDDASVEFTSSVVTTDYDHYDIVLSGIRPMVDNSNLYLRLGSSNAQDTGTNYMYHAYFRGRSVSDVWESTYTYGNTTAILLNTAGSQARLGDDTGESYSAHLRIWEANSIHAYKKTGFISSVIYSAEEYVSSNVSSMGLYRNLSAINFIKIYNSSGNLRSGTVSLYGLKK